jgi:hypothetical protein
MGEKDLDFGDAHLSGMPLVVEQDVTLDPRDVGFFGANRIIVSTPSRF